MFYCTIYRRQKKTSIVGRVDLCLVFDTLLEAKQARDFIINAATELGAAITDYSKFAKDPINSAYLISGEIDCVGQDVFKQGGRLKHYSVYVENEETKLSRRQPYHPVSSVTFSGKDWLQNNISKSSDDWYDELSKLNT